jgi:phytoene synthase
MPASWRELDLTTPHVDLTACRELLCCGSRSFYAASHLLPVDVRDAACRLYAFCRDADDLIDDSGDPAGGLAVLRERLSAIYRGRPGRLSVDRALTAVVADYRLPRPLLDALLEGFAWDATEREHYSLDDVLDYSARVAGTVGIMMALLMEVREPQALARAGDLGTAMQLTNIARDVGEDARNGRLYLPREWLEAAGIDPAAFLARPVFSPALGGVIERLLAEAERLYQRADSGIVALPRACRPAIYTARLLYSGIGAEVARNGFDSVSGRAVMPRRRKLTRLMQLAKVASLTGHHLSEPCLDANRFLVEAVEDSNQCEVLDQLPTGLARTRNYGHRVVWMLEMVEAMKARDRDAATERTG